MTTARYLVGDVFDVMAGLPDGSVDLVMTSPPFLALRSYLPEDHPDKHKEIGSEATPAQFLDTLLALTAEWGRLLAPHGSLCVELGDTYAGSGGAGGDYNEGGLRQGQNGFTGSARRDRVQQPRQWSGGHGWPMDKSLCGIPTLYAWSLAYGRNLLTGEESPAGRWRVRNLVAWVRPNPPVGALGDKFRPATSYLTIATRARDRYFDLDSVRTPFMHPDHNEANHRRGRPTDGRKGPNTDRGDLGQGNFASNTAGAPPLDWWNIPPGGYPGAHYAVYPPELCVRPILAMCPQRVCTTCGEPSRRIAETTNSVGHAVGRTAWTRDSATAALMHTGAITVDANHHSVPDRAERVTLGWSDCGHGTFRPGHVLDPFAGSGTTLAVATGHGREATGIDLDPRNADLARDRIGMFLTVDEAVVS